MTRFMRWATLLVPLLMVAIGCERKRPDFDANVAKPVPPTSRTAGSNNAAPTGDNGQPEPGTPPTRDPDAATRQAWGRVSRQATDAIVPILRKYELAEFALLEPERMEQAREELFALADRASKSDAPQPDNRGGFDEPPPEPRVGIVLEERAREFAAIAGTLLALAATHDADYSACLKAVQAAVDERHYGDAVRAYGAFGHRYWYEFSAPIIALRDWLRDIDDDADALPIGFYGGIRTCEPLRGKLPVLIGKLRAVFADYLQTAQVTLVASSTAMSAVERRSALDACLAFMIEVRDVWQLDRAMVGLDGRSIASTAALMAEELQATIERLDKEK